MTPPREPRTAVGESLLTAPLALHEHNGHVPPAICPTCHEPLEAWAEAAGAPLREALIDTLGSLHNIEARAALIVRWIGDANLNPVDEAKEIQRFRLEAHERIVAALDAATPAPAALDVEDEVAVWIHDEQRRGNLMAADLPSNLAGRLALRLTARAAATEDTDVR